MNKLLIEPHYFGCIEYFCLLGQYEEVVFEVCDSFPKQTYRNRALILGSNKVLILSIPLSFGNHTQTKDVIIDYTQGWIRNHWGAIYSAYGKAPYFDFFADDIRHTLEARPKFLIDLLMKLYELPLKLLGSGMQWTQTTRYDKSSITGYDDCRNLIQPKIDFPNRNIYQSIAYPQLFGNSFVPNLSIVDLIMCEGPRVGKLINLSTRLEGSSKGE